MTTTSESHINQTVPSNAFLMIHAPRVLDWKRRTWRSSLKSKTGLSRGTSQSMIDALRCFTRYAEHMLSEQTVPQLVFHQTA